MSSVDETSAQRFVRQVNESVERMRRDMVPVSANLTRQFNAAIEAARRNYRATR